MIPKLGLLRTYKLCPKKLLWNTCRVSKYTENSLCQRNYMGFEAEEEEKEKLSDCCHDLGLRAESECKNSHQGGLQ